MFTTFNDQENQVDGYNGVSEKEEDGGNKKTNGLLQHCPVCGVVVDEAEILKV